MCHVILLKVRLHSLHCSTSDQVRSLYTFFIQVSKVLHIPPPPLLRLFSLCDVLFYHNCPLPFVVTHLTIYRWNNII